MKTFAPKRRPAGTVTTRPPVAPLGAYVHPSARLALFGFVLPEVWVSCFFAAGSDTLNQAPRYVAFYGIYALVALAAGLLATRPRTSPRPGGSTIAGFLPWLALAGTLAVPTYLAPWPGLSWLGVVLGAAGLAALHLGWLNVYGHLRPELALGFLLLAFPVSELLQFPLKQLQPVAAVVAAALPVASLTLMGYVRRNPEFAGAEAPTSRTAAKTPGLVRPNLPGLLASVFMYGAVLGVLRCAVVLPFGSLPTEVATTLGKVAVFAGLFALFRSGSSPLRRLQACAQVILGLIVVCFLLLSVVGVDSPALGVFLSTARKAISVLIFAQLLVESQRPGTCAPLFVFGCGLGAYTAGVALGTLVHAWLDLPLTSTFTVLVLLAVALVATSILNGRHEEEPRGAARVATATGERLEDLLRGRLERTREESGLTEREAEVALLFCLGLSKAQIAERLYVSENTVRMHIKRAYGKLGVHDRRELLERLGVNEVGMLGVQE